jgi:hypothetical protein
VPEWKRVGRANLARGTDIEVKGGVQKPSPTLYSQAEMPPEKKIKYKFRNKKSKKSKILKK